MSTKSNTRTKMDKKGINATLEENQMEQQLQQTDKMKLDMTRSNKTVVLERLTNQIV
jgi:hypothetical protein